MAKVGIIISLLGDDIFIFLSKIPDTAWILRRIERWRLQKVACSPDQNGGKVDGITGRALIMMCSGQLISQRYLGNVVGSEYKGHWASENRRDL